MTGNLSGYSLATVFPIREQGVIIFEKTTTMERGSILYLCDGVSVLTAFLFSLPDFGAPCW